MNMELQIAEQAEENRLKLLQDLTEDLDNLKRLRVYPPGNEFAYHQAEARLSEAIMWITSCKCKTV